MSRASMYARYGGQSFGRVAPVQQYRRGSSPVRTDVRYYQERAGQAQHMQKVIGTTSAPSSDHQLSGFTADGYAIWEKKPAPAPAPAPAPSRPAPAPAPDYSAQIKELNEQAAAYRKQAEEIIAQGEAKVKELEDADLQRQKATELQNRLAIQAASSQARGQAQASLKIAPASQTAQTAGTAAFKRRGDRMRLAPIQTTAGINVPSGSVLNV
jgi:hypothetical protein